MLLEQAEVTLHGNMEATTVPCQMAGSKMTEAMLLLVE